MRLRDQSVTIGEALASALLVVARASVEYGFRDGGTHAPLPVDPARHPAPLRRTASSFVTLRHRDGALRGCIGELEARRSLVESVAANASSAAFRDPRFEPIAEGELRDLETHISVLGPLEPLEFRSVEELTATLRPRVDGLVLDDGQRRATFLPAVWASLPDPAQFVSELERKAGFAAGRWPGAVRASRYRVLEICDRASNGSPMSGHPRAPVSDARKACP